MSVLFTKHSNLPSDDDDDDYQPRRRTRSMTRAFKRRSAEDIKSEHSKVARITRSRSSCKKSAPSPDKKIVHATTRSQTRQKRYDWTLLPPEILLKIFGYASQSDMGAIPVLSKVSQVCQAWSKICRTPSLWSHISFSYSELPQPKKWKGNSISGKSFKNIVECYFERFKSVKFIGYKRMPCVELLNGMLSKCHVITDMGFFNCTLNLKNEKILQIIKNNSETLRSFKVKNTSLQKVLINPFHGMGPALEELVVETSTYCYNKNFFQFARMPNITVLKISIPGRSCLDLCQLEPLKKVQLVHITNTVLGVRADAAIKIEWPDLRELNVAYDDPSPINMHCGTINIIYLLEQSRKLQILNLKNRTPLCLTKLCEICPSTCLRYLNISGCVGPGFRSVFDKWQNSLEELYLDNCSNFMNAFYSQECPLMQNLKLLSVEKTYVTEEFITSILQHHKSLNTINLQCCRELPRGWKQLYCENRFKSFKRRILE